jgi:hypothetical protein
MSSGIIQCLACGNKGHIEIKGMMDKMPEFRIFRHLGHHAFTGHMHFLCPYCSTVLRVDPVEVLGEGTIRGVPENGNLPDHSFKTGLLHGIRNPGKSSEDSRSSGGSGDGTPP